MERMYVSGHTMEMLISSGFSRNAKIGHKRENLYTKTNIWGEMTGWAHAHPVIGIFQD